MRLGLWLAATVMFGCKNDQDVVRQTFEDVFYQEPTNEVDILWVVDNSHSMADEQDRVADGFEDFIVSLEDTSLDFHIGIITTDMEDSEHKGKLLAPEGEDLFLTPATPDYIERFRERVHVGTEGSDREKGIDAAFQALTEPLASGYNGGFLREGATLSIIYVSDENDCTDRGQLASYDEGEACYDHADRLVSVRELIEDYKKIKEGDDYLQLVSAIVGPEIAADCAGAKPGFRYQSMADAFGGLQADICTGDFAGIMQELGLQVSGVLTAFQLTNAPVVETMEVYVDDVLVPQDDVNGWSLDEEYFVLHFHGTSVPARGSTIRVFYEVGAAL